MAKTRHYRVAHTAVGSTDTAPEMLEGDIVAHSELGHCDVDRLIRLGALEPATDAQVEVWRAAQQKVEEAEGAMPETLTPAERASWRRAIAERAIAEPPATLVDGATVPAGQEPNPPAGRAASRPANRNITVGESAGGRER